MGPWSGVARRCPVRDISPGSAQQPHGVPVQPGHPFQLFAVLCLVAVRRGRIQVVAGRRLPVGRPVAADQRHWLADDWLCRHRALFHPPPGNTVGAASDSGPAHGVCSLDDGSGATGLPIRRPVHPYPRGGQLAGPHGLRHVEL